MCGPSAPRTIVQIEQDIEAARRSGVRSLVLVGGEPLARQDLVRVLQSVRRMKLAVGVATNGRMLVYQRIRHLLVRANVGYVRVALHGLADAHDALVGVPGAFDQTYEGLRLLLVEAPPSMHVDVACTVVEDNLDTMLSWVDLVVAMRSRTPVTIRFVASMDPANEKQWVRTDRWALHVGKALEHAERVGPNVTAAWEGIAPCALEKYEHLRDESLRCSRVFGPEECAHPFPVEMRGQREFPMPCQDCIHLSRCPGAPPDIIHREGEGALRPTRRLRANSFNFEFVREIDPIAVVPGAMCAGGMDAPLGPVRSVLFADGGRLALYQTPTRDFTESEISDVKDRLEQVYVDEAEGASLTDFMTSVRRVRREPSCGLCAQRQRCPGVMRVDAEPPFVREERWLAKEVSRLRGRVLDVGCGDLPYREELRSLIDRGDVEYHGVDPDEAALDRLKDAGIRGCFHPCAIESFACEERCFDYVLVLRSVNHFRDMTKAFDVITRSLRVQGQMVLCDSPPFAMLRTSKQVSYADENAREGHEHYRNWTSHQLVRFLDRYPFRVDVHRPVSAKTSNEWIVKVMRTDDHGHGCARDPTKP